MPFQLNDEQRAAVRALSGSVLISAGAGAGKTATLAERFLHALSDSPAERWSAATVNQILTITFTEKAAGELAERIRLALRAARRDADARAIDAAWIDTIHGFCSRILRRYALEAGVDPAFEVADAVEAGSLKQQAFEAVAREMAMTAHGKRVFGQFEFAAVFEAAETIGRELRTRGIGPEALVAESVPDACVVWGDAVALFDESRGELASCGDATASAASQLERCADTLVALEALDAASMTDEELGERTWRALEGWKPARSTKKTVDVRARLEREHAALLADAATCAAAPYAGAMAELVVAYEARYATLKDSRGVLDFDDLQTHALRLLKQQPDVRRACRREFRMVMVDEFQDTDALQSQLVHLIAEENLCTVGDERQSIYRFRGADIDVYRAHNVEMLASGGREFMLAENYRSHPEVLDFVNELFGSRVLFGKELIELRPGRTEPIPPLVGAASARIEISLVHRVQNAESGGIDPRGVEAARLADRLARLRDVEAIRPDQMAVLLRSYTHAETYAAALRSRGFETLIVGGSRFFAVAEVQMMREFLRVVANPRDEAALAPVLASPLGRLSDDALWLLRHAADGAASVDVLWEALSEPAAAGLAPPDVSAARAVRGLVERARARVGRLALSEIMLRAIEESDVDLILLAEGSDGRQGYANVLKLARLADSFEASGGAGPAAFEAYLQAKESFNDHVSPATLADQDTPAVRLMSIHASKGLEFGVVAVVGLGERDPSDGGIARVRGRDGRLDMAVRLPSDWSDNEGANRTSGFIEIDDAEKRAALEERKRLFYVASTRAEDVLLLSGVGNLGKQCPEEDGKTPLDWMRLALGSALDIPSGEEREARVGAARVRVARVDAECWEPDQLMRGNAGAQRDDAGEPSASAAPVVELDRKSVSPDEAAGYGSAPSRVSYSDLELFRRCGLRYFAERVLRVGGIVEPGSIDPREFGSAVHGVLQLLGDALEVPDPDRIQAIARFHGLDPDRTVELERAVRRFAGSDIAAELAASAWLQREWPFALRVPDEDGPFLLVGTIDAYARSGDEALIADYKTGESGDERDLAGRYELQARCYALAALRSGASNVRVVFVRPEVVDADGRVQTVGFEFRPADAVGIEAEIVSARRSIARGRFEALETWSDETCGECPIAESVCDVKKPARSAR